MRYLRKYCWLALLLTGCNHQDTEALQRISRKVLARAEPLTGEVRNSAASQWHSSPQEIARDTGLAGRVAARLRWDQELADIPFDIKATGNVVEIKGKVRNLELRRRVVMLAESTTGVEGVCDLLVESER